MPRKTERRAFPLVVLVLATGCLACCPQEGSAPVIPKVLDLEPKDWMSLLASALALFVSLLAVALSFYNTIRARRDTRPHLYPTGVIQPYCPDGELLLSYVKITVHNVGLLPTQVVRLYLETSRPRREFEVQSGKRKKGKVPVEDLVDESSVPRPLLAGHQFDAWSKEPTDAIVRAMGRRKRTQIRVVAVDGGRRIHGGPWFPFDPAAHSLLGSLNALADRDG